MREDVNCSEDAWRSLQRCGDVCFSVSVFYPLQTFVFSTAAAFSKNPTHLQEDLQPTASRNKYSSLAGVEGLLPVSCVCICDVTKGCTRHILSARCVKKNKIKKRGSGRKRCNFPHISQLTHWMCLWLKTVVNQVSIFRIRGVGGSI